MKTIEVRHPLVQHKLGKLRDIATDCAHFRQLAGEIAGLLAYEATRDLPVHSHIVQTWAGPLEVPRVRGDATLSQALVEAAHGFVGQLERINGARVLAVLAFLQQPPRPG